MSIVEKVENIKVIIKLIADVIPQITTIIVNVIGLLNDTKQSRKEIIMSGHEIGYRKSQSIFTRNAVVHKKLNNQVNVMRGGIRL